MKLTTSTADRVKLEETKEKAARLCKLYKCNLIDLMIISIDVQAERKSTQKSN